MIKWVDDKNKIECLSLITKERFDNLSELLNLRVDCEDVRYHSLRGIPIPKYSFNDSEERGWWVAGSKILTPTLYWNMVEDNRHFVSKRLLKLISSVRHKITKPIEIRVASDSVVAKRCCVDGTHRLLALEYLFRKQKTDPWVKVVTLRGGKINYLYPCEFMRLTGGK